jgi:hypothetical protein
LIITKDALTFPQFDLGEFNQKGGVATRWGSKKELIQACETAKRYGLDILVDAVLNVSNYTRIVSSILTIVSINTAETQLNMPRLSLQTQKIASKT